MPEPLEDSIAHLRAFSLHLNDVTDQATAAVRRVETFLNQECRLGLAVYVPVTSDAPDLPTLQLGYARTGERYRIVVRALVYSLHDGQIARHQGSGLPLIEREEQVAWSECARATKLEAFQHLPALLTALQAQVAEVVSRADAALAAAQRITAVLGEAPAPTAEAEDCGERGGCRGERGEGRHGHGHGHGHGHHGGHDHHGHGERGPGEERGHGRHKHGGGDKPPEQRRGWDRA